MESFWATLKRELEHIHGKKIWTTRAELRTALFDWMGPRKLIRTE